MNDTIPDEIVLLRCLIGLQANSKSLGSVRLAIIGAVEMDNNILLTIRQVLI